jgi:alkylated DNA repair dioxygenase AlkB
MSSRLVEYIIDNYQNMNDLITDNTSDGVLVFNKETGQHEKKKIYRRYKSYGSTPAFDSKVDKSYMFSELVKTPKSYMFSEDSNDSDVNKALPQVFLPLKDAIECTFKRSYNQAVVNWYNSRDDYIEMHSDCTAKMITDHSIIVLNINDPRSQSHRHFSLVPKDFNNDILHRHLDIELTQGLIIEMGGDTQARFRHGVSPSEDEGSKRISLTLRQMR